MMRLENCRLCQVQMGTHHILNEKDLRTKIMECTGINLIISEKYPKQICLTCKVIIETFHDFLTMVRKIDRDLKSSAQNLSNLDFFKCLKCLETFSKEILLLEHNKIHEPKTDIFVPKHLSSNKSSLETTCKAIEDETSKARSKAEPFGSDKNSKLCSTHDTKTLCNSGLKSDEKDLKSFRCSWENCDKICRSAYSLRTHEMSHSGKKPFLCVTCGKGFVTKHSINSHEKIHLKIKSYRCKICNIGFSVKSNLRAHEKKHHEGVRFHCSQCTREFITKCSLERHERLHTGIKEFQCQSCPSAFYTNKELVKHQRYHQGLKQHKCEQCFKSFFEKHHLTIHMRSHSGEKPYSCKIPGCNKSFTESQKLARHQKSKHAAA